MARIGISTRAVIVVLAAAAFALTLAAVALAKPKSGHYAGAGSIYDGQAKSTLPVAFTLSGNKVQSLTLGPAQVPCTGSGAVATQTMPQLTGFPTEKLTDPPDDEFTYYFEQQDGAWSSIGSNVAPPTGPLYVQVFASFYAGKKFASHGGIQIQYNADANGTPDPHGPLSCTGSWDGTFAKRK